ncbi:MAG: hypothetical protein KZQ70_09350 [gamma proteobacterium symbiont of Lucinoma myriamae]|nr:hypothetical protein [gamma proteobacterium symbiont of Lucinoma myriamae]MCU7817604.1 hypothetical protein [gamma proteobacterium symbiont of Lucinoma myriamae]MCU7832717.1 hypothetical protein [gamma proteobacterium symbiont of Lucinoma myriamae]
MASKKCVKQRVFSKHYWGQLMVNDMDKINFSAKVINTLQYNPAGAKVQRKWFNNFDGFGVSLGKTKLTFIHKFKSPVIGRPRINTLCNFKYSYFVDLVLDGIKLDTGPKRLLVKCSVDINNNNFISVPLLTQPRN